MSPIGNKENWKVVVPWPKIGLSKSILYFKRGYLSSAKWCKQSYVPKMIIKIIMTNISPIICIREISGQ